MTYTYKLARRLAIAQPSGMVAVLLLTAACTGEPTGLDSNSAPHQPLTEAFRIVPGAVTIETRQPIRFRTETLRTGAFASTVNWSSNVSWESSGGTISAEGTFAAAQPGTYKIVGRGRGRQKPDTSVVVVVPPQPDLTALEVTPDLVSLTAGQQHRFTVQGRLSDGSTAPVGVEWSATGGTIDPSGAFTAGSTPGEFRVVARSVSGGLADSAKVAVAASTTPDPEPDPEPEPEPTPTLAQVVLRPGTVALATGALRQFAAFGRTTAGDSVAVAVTYTATGGTITAGGLYTAGPTGGTFRVIAKSASGPADTAAVTLTAVSLPTGTLGIPFGPSQQLDRVGGVAAPFTMTSDGYTAANIVDRIGAARRGNYKVLLAMTGGKHEGYMSYIDGVYQFDLSKWRAKMETYNTAAIRQAVADGVRDGVIIGANVMDEPHVSGMGDGNTWGPPGTMTKVRVDGLCSYVKQIFPSLPVGVFHQHDSFEPEKSYQVCEFIVDQYNHRRGDVTSFRDAGLALARRDGHSIMFSLNILNGGVQDKDGTWDCTGPGQAGRGTFSPNCRMTPDQIRSWGLVLGPAGCALFMWRYDAQFVEDPANQAAFRDVRERLATLPSKSCARP